MKILLFLMLSSSLCFAQNKDGITKSPVSLANSIKSVNSLTLEAAFSLSDRALKAASLLDKKIAIAILDASGIPMLMLKGDGVGPHNFEAARRKAYTALSTKTATLLLLRNTNANPDTKNLNTLPELLLLSGGVPIWFKGDIIGSIGIAGGGSPENDDLIANAASLHEIGMTTTK